MDISHIQHRVEKVLGSVLGTPKAAPAGSQVLRDIAAGHAATLAAERQARQTAVQPRQHHVTASGRVVRTAPIPILPRGSYPPSWLEVHNPDEYRQDG